MERVTRERRVYNVNALFTKLTWLSAFVDKYHLSPLFLQVAFVDILFTNVYDTATNLGGGVSYFLRCAAPAFVAGCKVVMTIGALRQADDSNSTRAVATS